MVYMLGHMKGVLMVYGREPKYAFKFCETVTGKKILEIKDEKFGNRPLL